MVAKVISGKTMRGALSYNEHKVRTGAARCILAAQFGADPHELNFHEKLNRFNNLTRWNRKVKTNTLHISLNFDPSEKLSTGKLAAIATEYMTRIGFGSQPFLVYEHVDAAHPHIHILTTNVQENGKRIDIHNIGRNQSEVARQAIELNYSLVPAGGKRNANSVVQPISVTKAIYGKSETRRSISNIVNHVAHSYKYTSLPEYNAALRQFSVTADRGSEETNMYKKNGLIYSLLNARGEMVGVPVKASSIHAKPTLKYLEKQFKLNEVLRQPHKLRLRACIDQCFTSGRKISMNDFNRSMTAQGIYVMLRLTAKGAVFGMTFVDNQTRVVFNGSDLGKAYGARAITDKIADLNHSLTTETDQKSLVHERTDTDSIELGLEDLISGLVTSEITDFSSPESAMKLRRKKKRRRNKSN